MASTTISTKKTEMLIQIVSWIIILLSPFLFFPHHGSMTLIKYVCGLFDPLMMSLMFYLNLLVLVKRAYKKKKVTELIIINFICIVALGIIMELGNHYIHGIQFPDQAARIQKKLADSPPYVAAWLFYLRGMMLLFFAGALGVLVRLSQLWSMSEKKRKEAELRQAEAELQSLQNQVNPHFLLNTLNNIYALTPIDCHKAQNSIHQLSQLLRHLLYKNNAMKVPLAEEVEFIKNYIDLMKLRLNNNVTLTTSFADTQQSEVEIAPNILICLVENAFKHGVSPLEKSFIDIDIHVDQEDNDTKIVCRIANSNYPKHSNDKSGSGIGLKQVQHRLDLIYSGNYSWDISLNEATNTYVSQITITI